MPLIPDDEIERIKGEADLAAVVRSRGVALKPQGGDLVGLCPFHEDKNPSLHVTPAKRLWRCVSCHATGNVIQFVQKFDGVSFRHACELLKNGQLSALSGPSAGAPLKKSTVPKLASPLAADADDQAALRQVLDYYHERLPQNPAALAYLKKRGIAAEAVAAFRVGFVDRTLGLRLPHNNRKEGAALRARLTALGLLRESGHEHLRGRIVFPVVAESGEIGTVYGRAIDDGGKHERHLFLPGPQRGVWNPAALRSAEVILTEGIIDALTFWSAGFRHVTTSYSAKALPEEMLDALLAAKVARVVIAFDRDDAGDRGAEEVAAQLMARGIECRRVLFPHGHDANSYAVVVTPPEKSLAVLLNAAQWLGRGKGAVSSPVAPAPSSLAAKAAAEAAPVAPASEVTATPREAAKEENLPAVAASPATAAPAALSLVRSGEHGLLVIDGREYRVGGLEKTLGSDALKIALRLRVGERFHLDSLDLTKDSERRRFVERAAEETGLHADLLKRDVGRLLLAVEQAQAELARPAAPVAAAPVITEAERAAALALLRAPDLLARILEDFAACGVVGEETNKLVGYLAAVSRKLANPLAIIVQSTSAAGKSALMEAVLAFVPPEERVKYSALTGQALYYLGGDANLKHKILAIVEEEGAEKASYALKLLQSEGELSIASTGKDPHTGRMITQEYRVEGPVMIFLTTTAVDIDEELLNRCLILTVDEGREQTAAIHRLQRERETLAGLLRTEARAAVLALHRNAQRLLRPLRVVNPFAEKLTFQDDRTRARRDHPKYLALIRTLTLLHQYQRPVQTAEDGHGRAVDYIEVTLDDIAAANRLAHEVLGRTLDEMPPQTRRLLAQVETFIAARAAAAKCEREDVRFRARELREFCGWGNSQLHLHLGRLVELEYVLAHRADHGAGLVYELVYDGGGQDGKRHLPGLLDVEKLRAEEAKRRGGNAATPPDAGASAGAGASPCDYDASHPGQNEGHPAPIRPPSGPVPGLVRAPEKPDSSSERAPKKPADDQNARPRPGENDAAA
jgi:DNA primase catalytic core